MGFIPWDGMIEKGERRGKTKRENEEGERRGRTKRVEDHGKRGVDGARLRLEGYTLASPSDVHSRGYEKTMMAVVVTSKHRWHRA